YGQLYAGIGHGRTPKEELPFCDCEVLLDRTYFLPLGERSWPDDTLVELEYMDAPRPAEPQPGFEGIRAGESTKADVAAALGAGNLMRFDSGYEVWGYDLGARKGRLDKSEFVVLFSSSGTVAKTRLR